ncbi:hypothetical protein INT45_011778 [Circinella minor]|uniref:Uncharacterized protein n=1 Tax=Circinella minor TaxID=1195481 RepID=A0A8H7VJF6_9FUNG|nr:hypothetical protein INT45_011778 [Circinella minor]
MTQYKLPNTPLFSNAISYAQQQKGPAIDDIRVDKSFSYSELVSATCLLREKLLDNKEDLKEQRVAILCPSGFAYVVAQWAVWAAGGVAVPLCTTHPLPEQLYTIQDSQATLIIGHPAFSARVNELTNETVDISTITIDDQELLEWGKMAIDAETFDIDLERRAMILYTSGTTGKPKGVVTTHKNIDAQASTLVEAWYWSETDRIHHILPLHHVHGIINALTCPLYIGATVEMYQKFDGKQVWDRWLSSAPPFPVTYSPDEDDYAEKQRKQEQHAASRPRLSIFMSVPTVYAKLIKQYRSYTKEQQTEYSNACRQFRFMVSGSASLPTPLRDTWRKLSNGQVLLERYGMTEIGMALSQYYPVSERVEGTVGFPLNDVDVRLMAETEEGSGEFDKDVTDLRGIPGMVQVKGPNVFKEYWQRPEATEKEFTKDNWFITGDYGMRTGQQGYFRILGRASVDIIKTGGEKVSALEIERELLSASLGIHDVAVVGLPDPEWGQRVAAVVVLDDDKSLDVATMRKVMKDRLAVYKVPQLLEIVSELPKNAMGKVTKKALVKLFEDKQ